MVRGEPYFAMAERFTSLETPDFETGPFNEPVNPEPAQHHLEHEAKDKEDLDAVLDANEKIERVVADFTATGFKDTDRLWQDLELEERLGHKTKEQTSKFYANILSLTARELRQNNPDDPRLPAIEEVIAILKAPALKRLIKEGSEDESLAA